MIYRFDNYELDIDRYELRCAGRAIALEPQVFQLLAYLIAQRHRVVTKSELIDHLWPDHVVTDNTLHQRMTMARRVLSDNSQLQTCIKTIRGQGYRFTMPVVETAPLRSQMSSLSVQEPDAFLTSPLTSVPSHIVAREAELVALRHGWDMALKGSRQLIFITGEAGIGKTTVVDIFAQQIATANKGRLIHGQCVDQYGSGEAYMPVLEALERLGRGENRAAVVSCLAQYAPSWLIQLPSLLTSDLHAQLKFQVTETTSVRMLRELPYALEQLTLEEPILLVLEDLHWSDPSTLALLDTLARRPEPARLLVIGTYRIVEARRHRSELEKLVHELQMHQQCHELALTTIHEDAVSIYLSSRFPGLVEHNELTRFAYRRTEGHPLFLVAMVNTWLGQRWLHESGGEWRFQPHTDTWKYEIPLNLQHLIRHQIERLSTDEQELLAVASILGDSFSAAAVAACRQTDVLTEEAACNRLQQHSAFIHAQDEQVWPDGTVTSGFGFSHALYREVAYARVPVAQSIAWHRRIAARLEEAYETQPGEVAAQLALHYEQGRCYQEAIINYQNAARHALMRKGFQEAFSHLTHGLELLNELSGTPDRLRYELDFQLMLGPVLIAIKGNAAPEVEHTYLRARELCLQIGETSQLFPALRGLISYYTNRGDLQTAQHHGDQQLRLAGSESDPEFLMVAHYMMGLVFLVQGKPASAQGHHTQALALYTPQKHRNLAFRYTTDPGVSSCCFLVMAMWFLGYPDEAMYYSKEAVRLAREVSHDFSLSQALFYTAMLHQYRRKAPEAREIASDAMRLATEKGFTLRLAQVTALHGWSLAMQGESEVGISELRRSFELTLETGDKAFSPWILGLLVEAYAEAGQFEAGLSVLDEFAAVRDNTESRWYLPELYRLNGELLLRQSDTKITQAESCFDKALLIARGQQAKSWELRTAMSLARLLQFQNKRQDAYHLLASVYSWFGEGFDTADLQEAKQLLREWC